MMQTIIPFPVFQVVGYKNTGKTTLMEKLIHHLSNTGIHVGTLKHHGHHSPLKTVAGTDSFKHSQAGSKVAAVKGTNQLQIMINDSNMGTIKQFISLYTYFNIDLLLVEGFKKANYPKIVLLKNKNEIHLLKELTNIIAVGVRDEQLIGQLDYFTFSLSQADKEIEKLTQIMKMTEK